MAISLQDLQYLLNKQAAQAQPDAGSQAMMMAAQAARPAGAPPLPKPIDVEDGAGANPDLDKMLKEKDSELEKAKKENEKLRHDLNKSDLAHQQEMMMRDIEKKEKESLDKIKSEMEALKNEKTMHQAESVQHKAQLDKDTAMAQVKLEQQKSKALIDYNKQQVQEQIKRTDEARKESDRYKDEARKEADRMKDEARSYIDNYRSEVQKNLDAERSDMRKNLDTERATMQKSLDAERTSFEKSKAAISPALDQLMDNTLKSLNSIPTPEGAPIQLKQAYTIQDNDPFNIFNYLNLEQPINKQANTYFDDLIDGAVLSIPTPQNSILIKCADDSMFSDAWDAVTDSVQDANNNASDLRELYRFVNGIAPYNTIPGIQEEGQLLLKQLPWGTLVSLAKEENREKLKKFIMQRVLEGKHDTYLQLLSHLNLSGEGAAVYDKLNKTIQSGDINFDIDQTATANRLQDKNTFGYGLGYKILPHYVGQKVNSEIHKGLLDAKSHGLNPFDETSELTQAFQNARPTTVIQDEDGNNITANLTQSHVFSDEDQKKLVELWPSISIRNRQALGNLMSPYYRQQVGWTPLNSQQAKNNYLYNLSTTVHNNQNNTYSKYNSPTVQQNYQGYAAPLDNKYTSWMGDATNGWYDSVGALMPHINLGLRMAGSRTTLPTLAGYRPVLPGYRMNLNPTDIASEGSQLFKDVRLGKAHTGATPGAQSLKNQYKAYNN